MRVARITIGGLCMLDLTSGFVFPAPVVSTCRRARMSSSPLRAANDVKVTVEGVERTVALEEGVSILDGLEAHNIDAPHSCRSGLCTECAAMVTANLDNVKLEAAVLDPAISARGFVLTCSSTVAGPGVELELGVGDKMYEAQYGELVQGHNDAQEAKPGKWNLPFPDVSGA
ncbi:unnamed protein product [Ectocarpus sp. 4 AP-2014]